MNYTDSSMIATDSTPTFPEELDNDRFRSIQRNFLLVPYLGEHTSALTLCRILRL